MKATPDRPQPLGAPYSPATVSRLEARVALLDPLLVEAADDQDLSLIRWHLNQPPLERLEASWRAAAQLRGFTRSRR